MPLDKFSTCNYCPSDRQCNVLITEALSLAVSSDYRDGNPQESSSDSK